MRLGKPNFAARGGRLGGPSSPLGLLRDNLPLAAAIIAGLLVAFFSARFYHNYVSTHKETVRVVVPARDIPPYTIIAEGDLTWADIVAGGEDPHAARDISEVAGKLSLSTLYRGEQIRRERLVDPSVVSGRQVVSLNVDVARCVGGALQPGSLVDVWWVSDASGPGGWSLVATDAVVLDLRDSAGRSVVQQQGSFIQQAVSGAAQPPSPPAVVILAVKSGDVPRVIGGASMKSQNIVLAKKYVATGGAEYYGAVHEAGQPATGQAAVQPSTQPAGGGSQPQQNKAGQQAGGR